MNASTAGSDAKFPSGRVAGLDALRGGAMLLGILLHSAVAYMPTKVSHMLWPVMDRQTSWVCDVVFWGTHTFRLPLFFFLSGFFTEQLFQMRGVRAFLEQRIRRLLIPYLTAAVTVLPVTLMVCSLGWVIVGRCTWDNILHPLTPFDSELQGNFFNPGHLWFLLDLMVFNVVFCLCRMELSEQHRSELSRQIWSMGAWITPFLLAAPSAMLLWNSARPLTEFHNSFLPDSERLLYYGMYFATGAIAFRMREDFVAAVRYSWTHLGMAAVTLSVSLLVFRPVVNETASLWTRGLFAWSVTLTAWCSILGLLGAVIHTPRTDRASVRYLADASYWMYLVHLPIVGLTQIALQPLAWPAEFKMITVFGIAVLLSLSSYAVFVRHSVIGLFLHGRRDRPLISDGSRPKRLAPCEAETTQRNAA